MVTISLLDRHPNVLGHKLIAEALTPLLARELSRASQVGQVGNLPSPSTGESSK